MEKGRWVREKLKLEQNQPLIVYTGTFGLINGVGYLVDVAAIVRDLAPEVRFLLIGKGAEFNKVKKKAERLRVLNNNLCIWPPVTKTKMPDILAAATVATSLIIPLKALEYNSANKFFDALAAGKPVVINYGGWQADLLNKSGAGIVLSPHDKKSAAKRLIEFIRDEKRLEKASKSARILAHKKFNRDRLFVHLEDLKFHYDHLK
ncbi:MAG: glycosyltransferase [Candidatus Helarchaeota archaeon]